MTDKRQTLVRFASVGVGYISYLQIGVWLANHLRAVGRRLRQLRLLSLATVQQGWL
jgi:hypothetical protein